MTETDIWVKSFFFAQKHFKSVQNAPLVYDEEGEPLLRDKYNFLEYCARYADMCLVEYQYFSKRVSNSGGKPNR